MKIELNPLVDKYLLNGCMRCKYGGTPQCKVNSWKEELETLRQLVVETGLKEEVKWGSPVYTHRGKNIVSVAALKDFATIGFFKGVLLKDKHQILQQQGNLQSDRIVKFTNVKEIKKLAKILRAYVLEAIEIEDSGKKAEFKKKPEPMPDELLQALEDDPLLKEAFYRLTLGRQRSYNIFISKPKQEKTRLSRVEKCKSKIFHGKGWNER